MEVKMKKALITGGSGFIGNAISKCLENFGYDVYIFDQQSSSHSNHFNGSITNFDKVCEAIKSMDSVYHLAGMLGTSELLTTPFEAIETNIRGTVNVLEACRLFNVKRVFYPTKPNLWLNTYSITKKAGEDFSQMYNKIYKMDIRILRWLNAYGAGQKLYPIRKAIPLWILQSLYGLPLEIFGNGEQPVDLIYIDDLAKITVLYTEYSNLDSTVRDTGYTQRLTVNELTSLIINLCKSNSTKKYLPMRPGEYQELPVNLLENNTASDICNIKLTIDIEKNLLTTIEWYRNLPTEAKESALNFYYSSLDFSRMNEMITNAYSIDYRGK